MVDTVVGGRERHRHLFRGFEAGARGARPQGCATQMNVVVTASLCHRPLCACGVFARNATLGLRLLHLVESSR